jgi:hypothetical protein
VLKLSGGYVLQPISTALALDPTYGNPGLQAERSGTLIAGLEQPLPFEALLRLEGWSKWLSNLVVNPDTQQAVAAREAAGLPVYVNQGSGFAAGGDLMFVGRTRQFAYNLGVGLMTAQRTNPLASGAQTYSVQWEQLFSAAAGLSWSPSKHWLAHARANFRTGRPFTPVQGFTVDPSGAYWVPRFGTTDSGRYPFFFELNLRGEYRFEVGPVSCAVYLEVLNVTNTMNVYSWVYGAGDVTGGVPPTQGRFNHLPIRPFLGIRGEY